jgi:hypothetical protein
MKTYIDFWVDIYSCSQNIYRSEGTHVMSNTVFPICRTVLKTNIWSSNVPARENEKKMSRLHLA